jgi:hypothetical protein
MGNEAITEGQEPKRVCIALTVPYERKDHFREKYGEQLMWFPLFRCWIWFSPRKLPRDLQCYIHPSFPKKPQLPLRIELVPRSCWLRNLRHLVPYEKWREIRRFILNAARNVCEVCNSRGQRWPKVECHEVFHYDEATQTQKLVGLQAVCWRCHRVKHFGMGEAKDNAEDVLAHLCEINGWSREAATSHKRKQFRVWKERSELEWKMDFSFLKKHFNTRVKPETPTQRRERMEKIARMKSLARNPK